MELLVVVVWFVLCTVDAAGLVVVCSVVCTLLDSVNIDRNTQISEKQTVTVNLLSHSVTSDKSRDG